MNKLLLVSLFSALLPIQASATEKHVHGEAEIFIAIDGSKISIEMESPAANILGFEHPAKTAKEKILLAQSINTLQQYTVISTFPNASCQQVSATISSPFEDSNGKDNHKKEKRHTEADHEKHHDTAHGSHNHGHKRDDDSHTEFHMAYELTCKHPEVIKSAVITAFTHFSGLEKITVNWLTADKQGSWETRANKTDVRF
jgi:hypothetical protein